MYDLSFSFTIIGWQTRWLVLKDGILSYYNSKYEVKKGCRCSFKLSACDVISEFKTNFMKFKV